MTASLNGKGPKLADVADVASTIVKGVERSSSMVYVPQKWQIIMMVIRH